MEDRSEGGEGEEGEQDRDLLPQPHGGLIFSSQADASAFVVQ